MRSLFAPASIAVFGASSRVGSWGRQLAQGALGSGRPVQLVGRSLSLSDAVELAVIAVPAPSFEAAVDCALAAGAKALIGITAGAVVSPSLLARVREAGAVLLGPNCLGVFDSVERLSLVWGSLPAGDIALFSQSGNLALEIGALAGRGGLGFRRFASLGDCVDLRAADLLGHHGDARVVALYLEDFSDGRALMAGCASLVDSGIPVVLLAGGRSRAGAAAAGSHTGALSSDHAVLASVCRDAGVRLVRTPTELVEACRARSLPGPVRRLGIVADGGGHGIVAADLAEEAGLEVPVPPVDLAGSGEKDLHNYARAVSDLAASGAVDGVLLTGYFGGYATDEPTLAATEAAVADELAAVRVPLFVHSFAGRSATVERLERAGVPVWPAAEHALAAVSCAGTRSRRVPGPLPRPSAVDDLPPGDAYLSGRALLPDVEFPRAAEVRDVTGALAAAGRIGYPVVLKALGRAHKSDDGGVALDVRSSAALIAAFANLPAAPSYAVEQQIDRSTGIEMIVGGRRDPSFGPVVLAGPGGVRAELTGGAAVAWAPVDEPAALALVRASGVGPLLDGYRGLPALAAEGLAALIVAVGRAFVDRPRLGVLELNPVLVTERGVTALDCHWENFS
ncbi:acetate--CoA ligase family protein [Hamadaea tsunoensis]|uniref:acetate--CoA ligase family protein n=1 Tax=Hamadaea tsunoensis TaxID=53368 RepID=UPI00041D75A3|nr:acetate--CoA ligase family protein [Hamadaea tsunoensis]